MVNLTALVRRFLPIGRAISGLRDLIDDWAAPNLPLTSTYDEVIHDPKTGTYYGILYPKEEHEASHNKPARIRVIADETGESTYDHVIYYAETDASIGVLAPREDVEAFRAKCAELSTRKNGQGNQDLIERPGQTFC